MIKNKYFLIISIILLFFFYINYYQLSNQHWSSLIDQDVIQVYNSLLIASGLEQEYRDHPAFSTFLIHGFVFKIFSIFNNSLLIDIENILNSEKIDEIFQNYFQIARITNYFINFFLIISFYYLLKKIKIDQSLIIKILILLSLSQWYVLSFFYLRSENLSLLLFIIASILIISDQRIYINKFISGIFLAFSMLAKIQIIFLFPIYIFLLIPFYSNNNNGKFINNFLFLIFYIFFTSWLVLQLFLQEHIRFSSNKYFDLIIFSFGFIVINVYYFFISNSKFEDFKKKINTLSLSFFGFGFCIVFFLFLDFINIININKYIFLRISNPFHYMSEFTRIMANGTVNLNFLSNTILIIFSNYVYSQIELLLLLITLLFLYFKKNHFNKIYVKKITTLFLIFLLIVFITSLRYEINYHSYYFYTYLFFLVFCLERLDDKIVNIILVFCLIFTIYNNFFVSKDKYSEIFNRVSNLDFICISENTDKKISTIDTLKYWHSKINDKTIKKLCKYNSLN